ncbi:MULTISPECIES: EamA family transporter [Nostocales]|nr:DMT family transporter [Tolypothrix bouteillei]KAF3886021.1 DMT family transporter [Tolypothrix bouteillei VB521301]
MQKQNPFGLFAVVGASTFWALAANVASSLFEGGVSPFELAGVSAILATIGLMALNLLQKHPILRVPSLSQIALSALFVMFVGADYLAIAKLPVAIAIVLIFMAPGFVVLWNALLSRRVPSAKVLIALALSFLGVVLVSGVVGGDLSQVNWFGIAIGLTTAILFAAYTLLSEKIGAQGTPVNALLQTFSIASLIWFGFLLTQGLTPHLLEVINAPKILYMGIMGTLLPYLLFLWGVRHVQAERAAIVASIEPFIAGIIAWIWFGQYLTLLQITGGILIVVAISSLQINNQATLKKNRLNYEG